MSDARVRLREAVAEFRAWAASTPDPVGEWECGYDGWPALWATFREFLQLSGPGHWDQSMTEQVLYILARDNETETLKDNLTEHPIHLLALAKAGLQSSEQDARWQLADALGTVQVDEGDVVPILETYAGDGNEYVSRRALAISLVGTNAKASASSSMRKGRARHTAASSCASSWTPLWWKPAQPTFRLQECDEC